MLKKIKDIQLFTKNQTGVLYMVASVMCFAIMDICIKWLNYYPFGEVFFARFFFGLIPIFLIIPKNKWSNFYKTTRPGLHAFRAICGSIAFVCIFFGLRHLPLADVVALTFGGPIFVTIASIIFLSEKVGVKRWFAVFLGFVGMILIVQPAFIELNYYYISPILFCIFFSGVAISVRALSKTEPNYRIAFYFTALCTIIGLCTLPYGWIVPSPKDLFLFVIMGLCGSVANLLLTQSYRLAEASLVTPIKYLSLVYAITFGFIIWGEVPKPLMLAGAAFVILSSLIIFIREKKLKKEIVIPRS